jgi:hypothetical protein
MRRYKGEEKKFSQTFLGTMDACSIVTCFNFGMGTTTTPHSRLFIFARHI